jgi:hypothetical protein
MSIEFFLQNLSSLSSIEANLCIINYVVA